MTALLLAALFGAVLGATARALAPTLAVLAARVHLLFSRHPGRHTGAYLKGAAA